MPPAKNTLALNDRASLARAVTLVESTRKDHQKQAQALLTSILPDTGKSIRIGITGAPGVGKSTFIEAFGLHAIAQGHKVAVLAVDPSSALTGGSILGDKTRMSKLAQHESAFIRPSPASGTLGGVAPRTREAMLLCEAAGYDVIIVETVGVGQSETDVADMVDMFVLLLLPGSGDELQGIKKGIVELADLIVVNKADGDQLPEAKRVRADYAAALRLLSPHPNPLPKGESMSAFSHREKGGASRDEGTWQPQALTCSALLGEGIADVWKKIGEFKNKMSPVIARRRAEQAKAWMWKKIRETLLAQFLANPKVKSQIAKVEKAVMAGKKSAAEAATALIDLVD